MSPVKLCPKCDQPAKDGDIACLKCGHEFRLDKNEVKATAAVILAPPPDPLPLHSDRVWQSRPENPVAFALLAAGFLALVLFRMSRVNPKMPRTTAMEQQSRGYADQRGPGYTPSWPTMPNVPDGQGSNRREAFNGNTSAPGSSQPLQAIPSAPPDSGVISGDAGQPAGQTDSRHVSRRGLDDLVPFNANNVPVKQWSGFSPEQVLQLLGPPHTFLTGQGETVTEMSYYIRDGKVSIRFENNKVSGTKVDYIR